MVNIKTVKVFFRLVFLLSIGWNTINAAEDPRIKIARKKVNQGLLNEAALEFKRYLGENPSNIEVYKELAKLREKQKKFKLAIINYQFALSKSQGDLGLKRDLAGIYRKTGQIARSLKEWREIATLSKNKELQGEAEEQITKLMTELEGLASPKTGKGLKGDKKAGLNQKSKSKKTNHFNSDTYKQANFLNALKLFDEDKKDKALLEIKKAIKKVPGHPGAYYLAGRIRYQKKEYEKAIYNFTKGLAYPKKGYEGRYFKGRIYEHLGKKKKAINEYEGYLKWEKSAKRKKEVKGYIQGLLGKKSDSQKVASNSALWTILKTNKGGYIYGLNGSNGAENKFIEVQSYLNKNKPEKAKNKLIEINRLYGGSEKANLAKLNLSIIYSNLGLHKRAIEKAKGFLEVSKIKDLYPKAYFTVANSLFKQGKWEKAAEAVKKVTEVSGGLKQSEVTMLLSAIAQKKKDFKGAINYLENPKGKERSFNEITNLVELYVKEGKIKKAIKTQDVNIKRCEKALEKVNEHCGDAYVNMGDLYFKIKEWKKARKYYENMIKQYPKHKDVSWSFYQKGNTYSKENKDKAALTEYKKLVSHYPDSYWSTQAKWMQNDILWRKEYQKIMEVK